MYGIQYSAELRFILYHLINNAFPVVTKNSIMKEESKAIIASGKLPDKNWLGISESAHLTVTRVQSQHESSLRSWKEELLRKMQSIKMPVSPFDILVNENRKTLVGEVSERRIRIMKHHAGSVDNSTQGYNTRQLSSERSQYDNRDYYYVEKRGESAEDLDRVNQMEWNAFQEGKKRVLVLSETSHFPLPQLAVREGVFSSCFINSRRQLTLCLSHQMTI